ncbi:MAG: hypothetical protein SF182_14380 [Deltaproteobacteria bacterium]|nr:hypothetical protein [Deltaproteobacteria bacterium]
MTPRPDCAGRDRRRFGLLCVVAYLALAWVARFDMRRGEQIASLVYPLDTFSMYAPSQASQISHLLVLDAQGVAHRATAFRAYDCREPLRGAAVPCADRHGYEYHWDDLVNYIQAHHGPGDVEVTIVARTWEVAPGAAPVPQSDCVIAHCRAAR